MPSTARLDRRDFLKRTAAGTSGLVIGFYLSGKYETLAGLPPKDSTPINAWVQIAPNDSVTLLIDKSEMGQGVSTALAMILANELDLDCKKVKTEFAPAAPQQSNFNDYDLLRINETPQTEVHIVQSSDGPGGIGEPGTPPIAPAVRNAIFAATGNPFAACRFARKISPNRVAFLAWTREFPRADDRPTASRPSLRVISPQSRNPLPCGVTLFPCQSLPSPAPNSSWCLPRIPGPSFWRSGLGWPSRRSIPRATRRPSEK